MNCQAIATSAFFMVDQLMIDIAVNDHAETHNVTPTLLAHC